ncbi:hypothetical protein Dimus_019760 [Dionaea muscipula]
MKLKKTFFHLCSCCGRATENSIAPSQLLPSPPEEDPPQVSDDEKQLKLTIAAARGRERLCSASEWRPSLPAISEDGSGGCVAVTAEGREAMNADTRNFDRKRGRRWGSKRKCSNDPTMLSDREIKPRESLTAMIFYAAFSPAPFVI